MRDPMDIAPPIPYDQHEVEIRMTYNDGWGDGYTIGFQAGLRVAGETITNLQRRKS